MHVSDEQVDEFIKLYEKEFCIKLSEEDGKTAANYLLRLFITLYCPELIDDIT